MAEAGIAVPRSEIAHRVVAHFRAHERDLPWRRARDPYATWVSEIMLQQTRIDTVIPYYERWLARFPTVEALASAPLDDVLAAWAGLGYYSRARNLHRGAKEVVARYGGKLPASEKMLQALPGIGRYTAGAIASVAFGRPAAVVDGNVARVLARLFEITDDIRSTAGQNKLWTLAETLVPDDAAGDFNQGLMELGQTICVAKAPRCERCPLADLCLARAHSRQRELPRMPKRTPVAKLPLLAVAAAWIERHQKIVLCRRRPEGLYGGLWELPAADSLAALKTAFAPALDIVSTKPVFRHRQTLTHRRLRIDIYRAQLSGPVRNLARGWYDAAAWQTPDRAHQRGIAAATSAIIHAFLETDRWTTENRGRSRSLPKATSASSPG